MTNADRLAARCGWTHHPTVHHKSGMVTSNHWTKRVGDKVVTSYDHPMSTLDAVAGSLPEGWRWVEVTFPPFGGALAVAHVPLGACSGASCERHGDDEKEARINTALAAWEVSNGKA